MSSYLTYLKIKFTIFTRKLLLPDLVVSLCFQSPRLEIMSSTTHPHPLPLPVTSPLPLGISGQIYISSMMWLSTFTIAPPTQCEYTHQNNQLLTVFKAQSLHDCFHTLAHVFSSTWTTLSYYTPSLVRILAIHQSLVYPSPPWTYLWSLGIKRPQTVRYHSTSFHIVYLFILIISNLKCCFLFSYLFVGILYILWKLAYGLQILLSVRNSSDDFAYSGFCNKNFVVICI